MKIRIRSGPLALSLVSLGLLGLYVVKIMPAFLPPERLDCDKLASDDFPAVVIYGTSWCVYCKQTRWFLEDHDIAYCEYDIERSSAGASQYSAAGAKALPLIVVNGDSMQGFVEHKLSALLKRNELL